MVVVFLTSTFKDVVNGPAKFANLLLEMNERPGIEIFVLTEDVPEETDARMADYVIPVSIPDTFVNRYFGMLTRNPIYARAVAAFIKRRGVPDLLISNNAVYGLGLQRELDLPVLGMINDDNSLRVSIVEHGFGYQYVRFRIFKWFELRAIRDLRAIIVNSDYLLSVIKGYQPQARKLIKLYKSVDTEVTAHNEVSDYSGVIRILFVKSDFVRGGLFDLLPALGLIAREFHLTVIGPTGEEVTTSPEFSGVPANVTLEVLGTREQAEVFAALTTHHIFCTPSRMEALGVANMEALIHRTPVVFTNIGGIPEVMDYGNNGFAAEAKDPASLASAISSCLNEPQLREQKTAAGQKYTEDVFSKRAMFDRLEDIFRQIINEPTV